MTIGDHVEIHGIKNPKAAHYNGLKGIVDQKFDGGFKVKLEDGTIMKLKGENLKIDQT